VKSISGKRLCKILEDRDWNLKRINGSHYMYGKSGKDEIITVPVHRNKDLKIGLLKAIMKIAEIKESEL
jgi:predicted RNA binding protein YcfA (HicA-like mRNA interferase family)